MGGRWFSTNDKTSSKRTSLKHKTFTISLARPEPEYANAVVEIVIDLKKKGHCLFCFCGYLCAVISVA